MAIDITNKFVAQLDKDTEQYMCRLNGLLNTYSTTQEMLKNEQSSNLTKFGLFLQQNHIRKINDVKPKFRGDIRKHLYLIRYGNAAQSIVPQSLFVSLVSQYDAYLGDLLRLVYDINPKLLYNGQVGIKDVLESESIGAVQKKIIEDKIETILRKSHDEQIEDIEKILDVSLHKTDLWSDFIEITQRRNLFVHCQGVVSAQYIQKCKKGGVDVEQQVGDILELDETYFRKAYFTILCYGIMLGQTICRVLLKDQKVESDLDCSLISTVIYAAIFDEHYEEAIKVSEYAMSSFVHHATQKDLAYFVLNKAQAYKWIGKQDLCNKTLEAFDFSAINDDFLLAKFALEDNVSEVEKLMKKIGDKGQIMTAEAYSTWPIFKEMRKNSNFRSTYKDIFGDSLEVPVLSEEDMEIVQEASQSSKEKLND